MPEAMEIQLTQGKVALIDAADWELVRPYKWYAERFRRSGSEHWYAVALVKNGLKWRRITIHGLITEAAPRQHVIHLNGNGLDNRTDNICFRSVCNRQSREEVRRNWLAKYREANGDRTCRKCGQRKNAAEFWGSFKRCKDCINKRTATPGARRAHGAICNRHSERHRESLRAAGRRYYRHNTERMNEYASKQTTTLKGIARQALQKAVQNGEIAKPSKCEKCNGEFPLFKIHGHHPDYTKPLEVIWLCSICHGLEHRQEKAS